MDHERRTDQTQEAHVADLPHDQAARVLLEALAAGTLGIMGAVARVAASGDDKPMLRRGLFYRLAGDFSMGLGMWLALYAMGHQGYWTLFAAWVGGALGYAAVHDIALRILNKKVGP